jgi:putative Mg2+ transporter-C (MgtC) family protein
MISDNEVILRLLLSVLFSGLVGLEREVQGRAAGLRTHILVCTGSTLIMLTGLHLCALYQGVVEIDPGRIAAQVVSGIGFLGAGTIIQFRDSVKGLTTAASLWAAAGIGLAVGSGFYVGATVTTFIVLSVLFLLSRVERRVVGSKRPPSI